MFWPFPLSKIYVWLLPHQQKSKTHTNMNLLYMYSWYYNPQSYTLHTTVFYINKVMIREEVELFEWPSYDNKLFVEAMISRDNIRLKTRAYLNQKEWNNIGEMSFKYQNVISLAVCLDLHKGLSSIGDLHFVWTFSR